MYRTPCLAIACITVLLTTACDDPAQPGPVSTPDLATTATHRAFYVSPSGTSSGDGSSLRPWSLKSALNQPSSVRPGDTLWLRAGTYRGNFTSRLSGTAAAPIIVRSYAGQRATISGTLSVDGAYTWYWGFEVANPSSSTQNIMGIDSHGPGTKFINLVVHDHSGNGIGVWSEAPNAEVYGSLVYNNGFCGSSAGCSSFGHGIYAQNATGGKLLADNFVFQTFGYGFHLYTQGSYLRNFRLRGNVVFNNGLRDGANLFAGGSRPVENLVADSNMTYEATGAGNGVNWFGYTASTSAGGVIRNNYFVYGAAALRLFNWSSLTVSGNTMVSSGQLLHQIGSSTYTWSNNRFYGNSAAQEFSWRGTGYTFSDWRRRTGLGATDVFTSGKPSGTRVFVRPNKYERGRANVVVYNWAHQGSVQLNLSSVLRSGDRYEIRSVYNYFGAPITAGTYNGGLVTLPVPSLTPPRPLVGWPNRSIPASADFQAFVVVRTG